MFGVNGNQHSRLQGCRQPLQIFHRRMPAGMRIDEVDRRITAESGDFANAELARVLSVDIAEPLRVDEVDGGHGILEFVNEAKAGHLAEVKEQLGICVQLFTLDPVAIETLSEITKVVGAGLQPFVLTMAGENSYFAPAHGGCVSSDLPELLEHPCGIDVDDQEFAGTFAGPIGGNNAVDVLRGGQQERDVLLLLDCLKDLVFDGLLVREEIVVAMQHGAFEEEDIDVANWALYEVVEELPLSAMRAEIAAVEQALALGFDEECIGIGGRVVHQIRCYREFANLK